MLSAVSSLNNSQVNGHSAPIHFYASSGGNAGLACVYAAATLGYPASVVVPLSTTDYMISKLKTAGANQVIQQGKNWAEADRYLKDVVLPEAERRGEKPVYVPPFDDQKIWDGHATMMHEIVAQMAEMNSSSCHEGGRSPPLDAMVCSVGGGGLLCGIMQGLQETHMIDDVKVLALETKGAESLSKALEAGHRVTLPGITSIATHLGCVRVCEQVFEYAQADNVKSVVLSDAEAVDGCRRFADDERILVEPACGVCLAVCYQNRLKRLLPQLRADSKVVIVVCGGSNVSLRMLEDWSKTYS